MSKYITLDRLYDFLVEDNPELQIQIQEDGNLNIVAPTTLLENEEFMTELQETIMKVVVMGMSMGMYLPSELTEMLENYTKGYGDKK